MATCQVFGRLGKAPELKQSERGEFVTFTVASDEFNSDTKQRETAWWSCVSYSDRIVSLCKNVSKETGNPIMTKGKPVVINGTLTIGKYVNQQGETVINRNMNVTEVELVSVGQQQQQGNAQNGGQQYAPQGGYGNGPQVINVNEQRAAQPIHSMQNPQPNGIQPQVAAVPRSQQPQVNVAPQPIGAQPTQFAQPAQYGAPQPMYAQPTYGQGGYAAPAGGDNDSALPF